MNEEDVSTIRFDGIEKRLDKIDSAINDLQKVVVKDALQERDMKQMQKDFRTLLDTTEERFENLTKRISDLEVLPLKDSATKWDAIINMIFKMLISAVAVWFVAKLGF